MTTRIEADYLALQSLAARMRNVRDDLDRAQTNFEDPVALQSSAIEHSLANFTSSWSQQRAAIVHVLALAEERIREVADAFSQTDTRLANALDGARAAGAARLTNNPTY